MTPTDQLEALAGEFKSHSPDDIGSKQHTDGSWTMNGLIPILVLKDLLELDALPDEEQHGYHILSGMLMWCLDSMPKVGDVFVWERWRFTVLTLDGNRPDKIEVTPVSKSYP